MDLEQARFNMIEQQIRPWEVLDNKVLDLLSSIKRENFVQPQYKNLAFSDLELPLPNQQHMLLPKIEARLVQELGLSKDDKVLEIGTGSGYVTALLAKSAEFVYSVELDEDNKEFAVNNLMQAGVNNVSIVSGNGINGLPNKAPFDKIFVGGGLFIIPEELKQQLKIGGKLVGFIGEHPVMHAVIIDKLTEDTFRQKQLFETNVEYLHIIENKKFKF